ncbi:MAG TPA: thioredoxin-disulfide reductase [Dehalococcoidia bacterium]|nr:thioredoxin-disulfide reductase [Dehalococcoidia bacterium]
MTTNERIDIAIVGGGPAGLAAGLYAARALRRTVLWERGVIGGQIATTSTVENYPGFAEGVNGLDLALAMRQQAERFGLETRYEAISELRRAGDGFILASAEGEVPARAVIVTAGAEAIRLGVPGEAELTGRGVSYCATCDAAFFRDVPVAIVGGGDAAIDEALFTTRYASKVYVIHRRDELRASKVLQERAFASSKIELIWNTVVERVDGEAAVESLQLRDVRTGERRSLPVAAMFVFVGQRPASELLRGLTRLDAGGHAIVNEWMETDVPGLFAAGDIRAQSARQLVTAAGDGVTAAIRAEHYLAERFDAAA